MKKISIFLIIIGMGIGIWFWKNSENNKMENPDIENTVQSEDGEPAKELQEYLDTKKWKTYEADGFSFKYSGDFKVTSLSAESGEVITAEDNNFGFQIFVMPFDEKGLITPERIRQDLPEEIINEPKVADLDGAETLVFYGLDDDIGETFEAWTVHNGKLYQIMTTIEAEALLIEVLNGWDFK